MQRNADKMRRKILSLYSRIKKKLGSLNLFYIYIADINKILLF